jgi:hypothetical protein
VLGDCCLLPLMASLIQLPFSGWCQAFPFSAWSLLFGLRIVCNLFFSGWPVTIIFWTTFLWLDRLIVVLVLHFCFSPWLVDAPGWHEPFQ